MHDLFVQSPEAAVVLGLAALAVIAIIVITCMVLWTNHLKVESDAELKLNMLDRGMSVEEIERVLVAKSTITKPPAFQFKFHKEQEL